MTNTPQPSFARKVLFSLILLSMLIALMELGSFATLWAISGTPSTPRKAALERAEVLQHVEALSNLRAVEEERSVPLTVVPKDQGGLAPEVIHPFLGYVRDPNFEGPLFPMTQLGFYASEPSVPSAPAAAGASDPEASDPEASDPEVVSIGIFGGSVAVGLSREPSLLEALRRSPALADKKLWIKTFALGGYKQPQQLIALNYALALREDLDIVINLDGFNDIALAPSHYRSAGLATHFPYRWNLFASRMRSVDVQRLVGEIAYFESVRGSKVSWCADAPLAFSPTCHLVWKTADFRASQRLAKLRRALQERTQATREFLTLGPREDFASDDALVDSLVELWSRASLQMHQLCSAQGIRYFHFLQPNQYLPGSKELTPTETREAFHPDQPWAPIVPTAYPKLSQAGSALADQGVRFEDMSMLFSDVTETLYVDTCCHLNNSGNRHLAAAIAETIVRELARDSSGLES